jgi:hypothetical protein
MIAQVPAVLAQLPTVLALLGAALMALAIFAPPSATAAGPTVSFAPPLVPRPVERDTPIEFWSPSDPFVPQADPFVSQSDPFAEPPPSQSDSDEHIDTAPAWPALVDPRAVGCDVAARLALVDALIAVRAPWADALLRRAAAEERDPDVSAALAEASYFAGMP